VIQPWHQRAPRSENHAPVHDRPEQSYGIGELINSLRRAGYSLAQIRAMFPGLFSYSPTPGS
jgi:hypothetical protein